VLGLNFENVIFPDSVGFRCVNCGFCCRDEPPDINFKEQQKIESKGFENFLEAPVRAGDKNIRRKKDGSCFFLGKRNICKIQEVKPSICRLEPFIITKYDDKTDKIFLDLNPFAVKTCKGIFHGQMQAPEEIVKAAQSTIKDISEIIAKKTGLLVTDKKVATLTKKIIAYLNSNSAL
jgi:Fe-S-cluster containining protein